MISNEKSASLLHRATAVIPGAVNSPVRAWKAVGGAPRFIARGEGANVVDADGNRLIDYVGSYGPAILGHANPEVAAALAAQAREGLGYGAPTELEVELAERIVSAIPAAKKVRLVSSGTEAGMTAIRIARAATGRQHIIKFDGCYHGHSDSLLVRAGSGVMTLGVPDSSGVPEALAALTRVALYNSLDAVERYFQAEPGEIAAVIVEPVAANMGVVPPQQGFLQGLRRLTREQGALLVFDEVITGFRLAYGGAQEVFGVTPDLTCLGKIIGGGLPVGAYGGRRDIMQMMAPSGPVYQAGTLSGNPLAMTAGIETVKALKQPGVYDQLEKMAARLENGIAAEAKKRALPLQINRAGSLLTVFFADSAVFNYETARKSDTGVFGKFFQGVQSEGIYWPPSQFEAAFVSLAHTEADIEQTVRAAATAFERLKG